MLLMDQSSLFATSISSSSSAIQHQPSLFSQYKDISARLKSKTRSLIPSKKINLSDVSQQFTALGRELSPYNQSYEAFCQLAAAKAERLIPNSVNSEFQLLMQAARSFRDAGMRVDGSFDPENGEEISNAISCYRHAIRLCHQSQLLVVHHELGSLYERIGSYEEAGQCYLDAGSFRNAAAAFIQCTNYFAAVSAYESILEEERNNDDQVMLFLLKLTANHVHVLRIIERGQASASDPADEKRSDMRRGSSINMQDAFVCIRFPVIPLVPASDEPTDQKLDRAMKPADEELLLMNPTVLSLNIALESLFYFLRDVKNVNSVSHKIRTSTLILEDEGSVADDDEEEDYDEIRNEEQTIRNQLLNELFDRISDPCQRKLIHGLLFKD